MHILYVFSTVTVCIFNFSQTCFLLLFCFSLTQADKISRFRGKALCTCVSCVCERTRRLEQCQYILLSFLSIIQWQLRAVFVTLCNSDLGLLIFIVFHYYLCPTIQNFAEGCWITYRAVEFWYNKYEVTENVVSTSLCFLAIPHTECVLICFSVINWITVLWR
jgi:hypothetical protein